MFQFLRKRYGKRYNGGVKNKLINLVVIFSTLPCVSAVFAEHSNEPLPVRSDEALDTSVPLVKEKLSNSDVKELQCLNLKPKYYVFVTFHKDLSSDLPRDSDGTDRTYTIGDKGLVLQKRNYKYPGTGPYCEIFHSSMTPEKVEFNANVAYPTEQLVARLSRTRTNGTDFRGCQVNFVNSSGKIVGSLQCFVPGNGEATVGDLQTALGKLGEISVFTRKRTTSP